MTKSKPFLVKQRCDTIPILKRAAFWSERPTSGVQGIFVVQYACVLIAATFSHTKLKPLCNAPCLYSQNNLWYRWHCAMIAGVVLKYSDIEFEMCHGNRDWAWWHVAKYKSIPLLSWTRQSKYYFNFYNNLIILIVKL